MSFRSISKYALGITAAVFVTTSAAFSATVTLRSLDGSVSMGGELVSFDGTYYVLKSALGQVQILAAEVICEGENCPSTQRSDFRLAGSSTVGQVLIPSLFNDFARGFGLRLDTGNESNQTGTPITPYLFELPDGSVFADVEVHSLTATDAFAALYDGSSEIALSSRAISAREVSDFASAGLGDLTDGTNQVVAALDGLVIIVPPENELPSLSMAQMTQVFSGRINNWAQLGGDDAPINIYRRDDASGSATDFASVVLNPTGARYASGSTTFTDDFDLVEAVLDDPNAIGFTSIAYQSDTRALPLRDSCGFISEPTEFTVKTGEYPLSRRVYLYTTDRMYTTISEERSDKAMGFLQFVQSNPGQKAAENSGFVSQLVSTLPVGLQGQRMVNTMVADLGDVPFSSVQRMVASLNGAVRLSTTFRFKPSVSQLDAQARGDIPRLAAYLKAGDFGGMEILIAGFSDADGGASANANLSQRRAQQVLNELQVELGAAANDFTFVVDGFGEVSPQGCNATQLGRSVNRRVEVWVREAT